MYQIEIDNKSTFVMQTAFVGKFIHIQTGLGITEQINPPLGWEKK